MQQNHSNIIVSLSRRLMAAWQQYRLHQWQQMNEPRLLCPVEQLPKFVQQCRVTMSALPWLRLLDWSCVPHSPHIFDEIGGGQGGFFPEITTEWQHFEHYFSTFATVPEAGVVELQINGRAEPVTIWLDDVQIAETPER